MHSAPQVAGEVLHVAARVQHEGVTGVDALGDPVGLDKVDHDISPFGVAGSAWEERTGLRPVPTGLIRKLRRTYTASKSVVRRAPLMTVWVTGEPSTASRQISRRAASSASARTYTLALMSP